MQDHRARGYHISDFLDWQKRNELVLTPRFQRRPVWSAKARSFLIDTIVRDLPIPVIFIREKVDPTIRQTVREVVDGQQRLRAIIDFVDDAFPISKVHNKGFGGKTYSELPPEVQSRLLSYELSVSLLVGATDPDVLDIFSRINTYTVTLNDQEKLNAEYFGYFKRTVYDLGYEHLSFWRNNNILSEQQIARMQEAELTGEIVVAMLDGLQDKRKNMRKFYKDYDEEFPKAHKVVSEFHEVMDLIGEIADNQLGSTPFSRPPLFYSLFGCIYDLKYGLPKQTNPKYTFPVSSHKKILEVLKQIGVEIAKDPPGANYIDFILALARHTNDLKPRQTRHKFLVDAIAPALKRVA